MWPFWRFLYRPLMRFLHRHHCHYAPPIYIKGDTIRWCRWCGFRQVVQRAGAPRPEEPQS